MARDRPIVRIARAVDRANRLLAQRTRMDIKRKRLHDRDLTAHSLHREPGAEERKRGAS